jgi:glycerol-3-phosphate acyltransferase PlsY
MDFTPGTIMMTLALGYLLGSIPFGLLITRIAGQGDIREIGSGNIGATNVLRTGRKDLAAATLLLDALKGALAVWIGGLIAPLGGLFAAIGAFCGHIAPAWLDFKGGKGVATFLGILFALYWPAAVAFCAVWLTVAAIWRYSSVAALAASAVTPAFLLFSGKVFAALVMFLLAAILWGKHRDNITRLRMGAETRIGEKS